MFFRYPKDFKERKLTEGITLRLVWGERIMLSYATFQPNSILATHSHPHEQTGMYVVSESGTIEPLKKVDTLKAMPLVPGGPIIIPSCG